MFDSVFKYFCCLFLDNYVFVGLHFCPSVGFTAEGTILLWKIRFSRCVADRQVPPVISDQCTITPPVCEFIVSTEVQHIFFSTVENRAGLDV